MENGLTDKELIEHFVNNAREANKNALKHLSHGMDMYYNGKCAAYLLAARYIKGYATAARYGKAGAATRRNANA